MLLSSTKNALSRTASLGLGGRPFSSTGATAQMIKSMADLLQEVPPELRIPVSTTYNKTSSARKTEGRTPTVRPRRETVSFGNNPNSNKPTEARTEKTGERLYKRENGAAGGFGSMMRKEKAAAAGSSSGASRSDAGRTGQRERNGQRSDGASRSSTRQGSQQQREPRERFSRVRPVDVEPPVQKISLEDYKPIKPRGQDDLFGTTSLLDVDVASMDQVKGENAEFVGDEQGVSADRDSALHRALLSVGSYSHLVPSPFAQSTTSTNAILDPKTNRETLHRFAVHQADFALTRGVNVSEGQRGIAKGVIMGRLGVKA